MEGQSRLHQEIRRLRQYLEAIRGKGCAGESACRNDEPCASCIAGKALDGFESSDPVKWTLYMHDDGNYTLKSGSKVAINMPTEKEVVALLRSGVAVDDSIIFKSYRTTRGQTMSGDRFIEASDTDIAAMLQQI